jgi:uncharacterized protein Yka (UPF0111/DUF47 family)
MLRTQATVTVRGLEAFAEWAAGDATQAENVGRLEHAADDHKRELRAILRTAFSTPVEPEDLFELSRGIDALLNGAKNTVREAEVMAIAPDEPIAEMAALLADGMRELAVAVEGLTADANAATAAADAAVKSQRKLEKAYRRASAALLEVDDLRLVSSKRELYRRLSRLSELLVDVSERVWFVVVKEA